jgi:hypothetical protein
LEEVTRAQKSQISAFWKEKKTTAASTTVSVHQNEIQSAPSPSTTTTHPTPTPHTVMTKSTDVRHLLSNSTSWGSNSLHSQGVIDGRTYTLSYSDRTYSIHQNLQRPCGSLIDGGANGGFSGSDVVVLSETLFTADFTGIADNSLQKVSVCTVAGLLQTQHGPIIGVFHQYALHGTGKTIHSVAQLRHFGTIVDKPPSSFDGKHRLETLVGYISPLSIRS